MTKLIEHVADLIEDEVKGAEGYVLDAVMYKKEFPTISKIFYDIAMDELRHVNMLHGGVVGLIEMYKADGVEPPVAMMAIYEYLHKKHIKAVNEIKMMQQQY